MNLAPFILNSNDHREGISLIKTITNKNQWNQTYSCRKMLKTKLVQFFLSRLPVIEWTKMVPTIANIDANICIIQWMLRFVLNIWKNDQEFDEYKARIDSVIKNWYWNVLRSFKMKILLKKLVLRYTNDTKPYVHYVLYTLNPKW